MPCSWCVRRCVAPARVWLATGVGSFEVRAGPTAVSTRAGVACRRRLHNPPGAIHHRSVAAATTTANSSTRCSATGGGLRCWPARFDRHPILACRSAFGPPARKRRQIRFTCPARRTGPQRRCRLPQPQRAVPHSPHHHPSPPLRRAQRQSLQDPSAQRGSTGDPPTALTRGHHLWRTTGLKVTTCACPATPDYIAEVVYRSR